MSNYYNTNCPAHNKNKCYTWKDHSTGLYATETPQFGTLSLLFLSKFKEYVKTKFYKGWYVVWIFSPFKIRLVSNLIIVGAN